MNYNIDHLISKPLFYKIILYLRANQIIQIFYCKILSQIVDICYLYCYNFEYMFKYSRNIDSGGVNLADSILVKY